MAQTSGPQKRSPRATRTKTAGQETQPAPSSSAQQPQPSAPKPTLEQFIGQHDKLLGAMAVLAALAAFMKDLQIIGGYLSFIFTVLVLLVWFELLTKFPKQSGTNRLVWFENLLTIGVLGLVLYLIGAWLVAGRASRLTLVTSLVSLFMVPALWASLKVNDRLWLKRFEPRGELDRFMIYFAIVGSALVVAYTASNLVATPVTGVLNSIQPPAASPKPSPSSSPMSPTSSPHASVAPT